MMNLSVKQLTLFALFSLALAVVVTAEAARVDDLYVAEVALEENTGAARSAAFSKALNQVLVKVTGLEALPEEQAASFSNAAPFIRQYRILEKNLIQVTFDPVALRRQLDAAGLPVWSAERPVVMVWLAVDQGQGRRDLLGAAGMFSQDDSADRYRDSLYAAADARGLPVVLPLLDGEDLSKVSVADAWGGFGDVLVAASERYAADATLVGRLREVGAEGTQVRWSMYVAEERVSEWEGDVAAGPRVVADILAQQLATYAADADAITVTVRDIVSLEQYSRALRYLRSLSIVDQVGVSRVLGSAVEFSVTARSDSERLSRDIARGGVFEAVETAAPAEPQEGNADWSSFRVASDGLVFRLSR